jgi:hypothetical protein
LVWLLPGPAVLLVGSALEIGGLCLPWDHFGAPYVPVNNAFVPMQSWSYTADLYWLVLAAIPIMATLVSLGITAIPRLRRHGLIRRSAIFLGLLTLVAGGVSILSLILFHYFLTLEGVANLLMDSGYFISLAGSLLLVPGAILLMLGQRHVSKMVRLGQWRAP